MQLSQNNLTKSESNGATTETPLVPKPREIQPNTGWHHKVVDCREVVCCISTVTLAEPVLAALNMLSLKIKTKERIETAAINQCIHDYNEQLLRREQIYKEIIEACQSLKEFREEIQKEAQPFRLFNSGQMLGSAAIRTPVETEQVQVQSQQWLASQQEEKQIDFENEIMKHDIDDLVIDEKDTCAIMRKKVDMIKVRLDSLEMVLTDILATLSKEHQAEANQLRADRREMKKKINTKILGQPEYTSWSCCAQMWR